MKRFQQWHFIVLVALLATLVTTFFTFPLVPLWRTHIPSLAVSDGLEHIWFSWWFDKALFTGRHSPALLKAIYYPFSVTQPLLTAMPWSRVIVLPGVHSGNAFAAYNVHIFASYVLTWVLMTLLCQELVDNRWAALIGGAIFTFFANRTMHVLNGHLTQALTYAYPLLVLCLWRLLKQPALARGIWLGLALVLASTIDLMPLAYFAAPVTAAILLYFLLVDRSRLLSTRTLKSLALAFGLAALVLLPLLWPLLRGTVQGELGWYQAGGVGEFSADALALFVPPPGHVLARLWPGLQRFSHQIYSFGYSHTESIVYGGWVTLALAAIGTQAWWQRQPDVRLWTTVALVSLLLALGPILRLGGRLIYVRESQWVILPYYLVMQIPLLSWGRTPARLHFTAMFALAILAAFGVRWLLGRIESQRWQGAAAAALLFLVLLDALIVRPWPMFDTRPPSFYAELAAQPRSVAILDLPTEGYMANKYYMLYQMEHGHAIVGGHSYRQPQAVAEKRAELEALVQPGGDLAMLAEYGIGYIVLHQQFLEPADLAALTSHLTGQLAPPLYQDEHIVAFALPDAKEIAPQPVTKRYRE